MNWIDIIIKIVTSKAHLILSSKILWLEFSLQNFTAAMILKQCC